MKEKLIKSYIIVHMLLQYFYDELEGYCSNEAEQDLFVKVFYYCDKPTKKRLTDLLDEMEFVFGLSKRHLTKAEKHWDKIRV